MKLLFLLNCLFPVNISTMNWMGVTFLRIIRPTLTDCIFQQKLFKGHPSMEKYWSNSLKGERSSNCVSLRFNHFTMRIEVGNFFKNELFEWERKKLLTKIDSIDFVYWQIIHLQWTVKGHCGGNVFSAAVIEWKLKRDRDRKSENERSQRSRQQIVIGVLKCAPLSKLTSIK